MAVGFCIREAKPLLHKLGMGLKQVLSRPFACSGGFAGTTCIQHVLKLAGFWHLAPWALEKQGSYIACQGSQWNHGNASSTSCAPAGTCPITWFSSFWMFTCSVKQAASHRRTFLHMPEAFRKLDATCTCDFFRLYTLSCCLQPVCNWKPWRQVPKQYTHFCPTTQVPFPMLSLLSTLCCIV